MTKFTASKGEQLLCNWSIVWIGIAIPITCQWSQSLTMLNSTIKCKFQTKDGWNLANKVLPIHSSHKQFNKAQTFCQLKKITGSTGKWAFYSRISSVSCFLRGGSYCCDCDRINQIHSPGDLKRTLFKNIPPRWKLSVPSLLQPYALPCLAKLL